MFPAVPGRLYASVYMDEDFRRGGMRSVRVGQPGDPEVPESGQSGCGDGDPLRVPGGVPCVKRRGNVGAGKAARGSVVSNSLAITTPAARLEDSYLNVGLGGSSMSTPFAITLFATTGDPQGIRHIDKSNWSGFGVVFPKERFHVLKNEPGFNQAGVYILVGNAAEETIYIGEADPVGERLKNHVANKEGWNWGLYFIDRNHKIGKTEVQFLESALVARAKKLNQAIVLNKNNPTEPTMSGAGKAAAYAFLDDILLVLPMLGINAFGLGKGSDDMGTTLQPEPVQPNKVDSFDTIVVPAREDGFNKVFLGEDCWYAIRLNAKQIPNIKYVVGYQVAPVAAITHIAKVLKIEPYGGEGKYILRFDGPAVKIGPIPRPPDSGIYLQGPRYAMRAKVLSAKKLDDVWA